MLDEYTYGNYNEAQVNAVATLMRDCGVAADMQYGGSNYTENGSGAYSTEAAAGLRTYFGIADAECLERDYYSDADWMDKVYTALSEDGPIYYGGASYSSGGHAFVLHGYRADGMVYVNWGWSGDEDGYYNIDLLNPGYYHFDMGQDMIIGVKGAPRELTEENVELAEAGTLITFLGDDKIGTVGTLKITGNINGTDLRQIRRLGGVDEKGEKTDGYLQVLDLSEAHIVNGGDAYLTDNGKALTTADDELPAKAFFGCKYLRTVKLPAGLKSWGEGALGLCNQLRELEIGTPAEDASFKIVDEIVWNNDQNEIVAVLPTKSGELSIPKGTIELHNAAMAGCARLSKVVIPVSLTKIGRDAMHGCSGLSEIRIASKEVPELGGADVFTGVSFTNCKLYVPAGTKSKYTQQAQWKNFKGSDFDNIVEYGSSVKVRNTIRKYGEENPTFTYTSKGAALAGEVAFITEAVATSTVGEYVVSINGSGITNSYVTLKPGKLTITKAPLAVGVEDCTITEGEALPKFILTFDGFKNNEDESVLTTQPTVTTDATETSAPGDYVLVVSGGEATNYELTYTNGKLTIQQGTGIEGIHLDKPMNVYTIDGVLVRSNVTSLKELPAGVYIINRKKVVVK
jgi:hypothetical protein